MARPRLPAPGAGTAAGPSRIPEPHTTHSKTPFECAPVRIDNLS